MSMSRKKRRAAERNGRSASTRPRVWGRTRAEVRDAVLAQAGHRCEWCGAQADQVQSRHSTVDKKAQSKLAAWCGQCDPAPGKVSAFGYPSRFAQDPPWKGGAA